MATFIILGIIQGSVLGLLALGVVLVYKGTRVFNFAQAEFATLGAYFAYIMTEIVDVPYLIGILLALVLAAGLGYVFDFLIVRPLFTAPRVTLLVATAGFALLAISLEIVIGKPEPKLLAPLKEGAAFGLFGYTVSWQQLLTVLVLAGLSAGLAYFFNKTDLGLAILATSQEPVATELVGISTRRMSSFIWMLAAVLGAIAGILYGPDTRFAPAFMTRDFLLLSFGAAVVGGVTSLSGAVVGGQLIGIFGQVAAYFDRRFLQETVGIPGFSLLLVFILLVTVLIVRPRGLLGSEA